MKRKTTFFYNDDWGVKVDDDDNNHMFNLAWGSGSQKGRGLHWSTLFSFPLSSPSL